MRPRHQLCAGLMLICFLTSGCAEITVGPRVQTNTVIMHPGNPAQILEQQTLKARTFDNTIISIDVGGWVAMDPEHWNVIAGKIGAKLVPEGDAIDSGAIALPPAPSK